MADVKIALEELKEESDSGVLAGTLTPRTAFNARRIWVWGTAVLLVVAIAVMGWLFRGGSKKPAAGPEVVPLTTYAGIEQSPSFSPDGNQLAFSWNGEKQDNFNIYLKLIGSQNYLRLTTDPADDFSPAFSPDGRSIGFIRVSKERAVFIVIPAICGPEHIVAEVPTPRVSVPRFAWFPTGSWVVTDGLLLLSTETGETRNLTSPPTKSLPDLCPSVSPDGRSVAFSRSTSATLGHYDFCLLDLTEELKPKGEPRRLSSVRRELSGSVWTPNGQEIIFSSRQFWGAGLWRIPAFGAGRTRAVNIGWGRGCPTSHLPEWQPVGILAVESQRQHLASCAVGPWGGLRSRIEVHHLHAC
jgi:dipeptidyl aminopeptidase/acylaminoacyl peptidase